MTLELQGRLPAFLSLILISASALARPSAAQSPALEPDEGWTMAGSFRGSTASRLSQQLNDFFFEQENYGSLYQDLGDLSLGLDIDFDNEDGEVEWDNTFYHQVFLDHRPIPAGGTVEPDDLSRYLDVQTLVSRGRINWAYVPDIVGDTGLGLRMEAGTGLTLARAHPPLDLGRRQLESALEDRIRLQDFERDRRRATRKSLLDLGTEGVAWFLQWIAGAIGEYTVDTEQGAIFFENYAEPLTLFIDLGIPVDADFFRADDSLLTVGDRVRQITFVGLSPVNVQAGEWGLSGGYQRFYRFLRETTITKEEDDHVRVRIRNAYGRGHELVPLKVRPEVRVLGIVKIGYTFFEQIWGRGRTQVSSIEYRIDLDDERGLAAFRDLLGDGGRVRFRPLTAAALDGEGVEILDRETRRGQRRRSDRRVRFFSWFTSRNNSATRAERIAREDGHYQETSRARNSRYEERFGDDHDWWKRLLVTVRREIPETEAEAADEDLSGEVRLAMLSGLTDNHASGDQIQRAAMFLRQALPWVTPPNELEQLAQVPRSQEVRFFANLALRLEPIHIDYLASLEEDRLWRELAELLLGPDQREAWSTPARRRGWAAGPAMSGGPYSSIPAEVLVRNQGSRGDSLTSKDRYRIARRTVRRFQRLQRLLRDGDCPSCLVDAFARWRDINLMQLLMLRLAAQVDAQGVGYAYEIYSDDMLRPVTDDSGDAAPAARADREPRDAISGSGDWMGAEDFLEQVDPRLRAGTLEYRVRGAGTADGRCWKLRLFSDLRFSDELFLRVDLRRSPGGPRADRSLAWERLDLPEPTAVQTTPFLSSRFYYDIPLPMVRNIEEGHSYTLLVRVLNPGGQPVTEEQQVRFAWPEGASEYLAESCRPSDNRTIRAP